MFTASYLLRGGGGDRINICSTSGGSEVCITDDATINVDALPLLIFEMWAIFSFDINSLVTLVMSGGRWGYIRGICIINVHRSKSDCENAARYLGYDFLKDRVIPAPGDLPSKCIWDTAGTAYFNQLYSKTGPNVGIKSTTIGGICNIKGRN